MRQIGWMVVLGVVLSWSAGGCDADDESSATDASSSTDGVGTDVADVADATGPCARGPAAFQITGHSFTGQYLTLDLTYSGGCADHRFEVRWAGTAATSAPPQLPVELHHFDGGDTCESVVQAKVVIDCTGFESHGAAGVGAMRLDFFSGEDGWPRATTYSVDYTPPATASPAPAGATILGVVKDCGGISG